LGSPGEFWEISNFSFLVHLEEIKERELYDLIMLNISKFFFPSFLLKKFFLSNSLIATLGLRDSFQIFFLFFSYPIPLKREELTENENFKKLGSFQNKKKAYKVNQVGRTEVKTEFSP